MVGERLRGAISLLVLGCKLEARNLTCLLVLMQEKDDQWEENIRIYII